MIGKLVRVGNDPCISIKNYVFLGLVLRKVFKGEYPWLKSDYNKYYKVYTNKRTVLLLHKEEISEL